MVLKKKVKQAQRALARWLLYTVTFFVVHLPYWLVQKICDFLIAIGLIIVVRQKRIALESLRIAFGQEKTPEEIQKIFKDCFVHVGKSMMELIYFMAHPSMIQQRVFFENKERLQEAFAQGRGVIAVSAHFGNFPLMLLRLAQEGFPTNAIIRPARDTKVEKYFQEKRTDLGLKTLYSHQRQKCVADSLKALRNNEFLFVPLDQNFGSPAGVFVDFFGRKAATATGPVVFALRTQAPILPIFIVRQNDDTHKIIIEPPVQIEEAGSEEETLIKNVSKLTQIIERYIRQYPQEWGWMHRRWKNQPVQADR